MSYQALYRVWRPQTFHDVVGQQHITQTLQNALQQETYTHAYLFSGPRGTGKTSTAKILAKAVNCEHAPIEEPCNQCWSCQEITKGKNVDVVEIDAASNNGVDEIRDLRDKVKYAPTEVKMKVYIIDEVHMLSQGAFNALLKTLEEPPDHVMFILATTEPHKIPLTIVSRCQRFDFRRVSRKDMSIRMQEICSEENIGVTNDALHLLAQVAEGGMRDALSLLDQAVSFAEDEVTMDDVLAVTGSVHQDTLSTLADQLMQGNVEEAISTLNILMDEGKEPIRLVEDLIYYYRDVLMYRQAPELESVLERVQVTDEWKAQVQNYESVRLFEAIERMSHAQQEMKWSHHPRIFLEVAMVQFAQGLPVTELKNEQHTEGEKQHTSSEEWDRLAQKVDQLEQQLSRLQKEESVKPVGSGAGTSYQKQSNEDKQKNFTSTLNVSSTQVKQMLRSATKSNLIQLQEQWPAILEEVKSKQIMVHAWLRDSEPVACSAEQFLLVFKSDIHRETTEKESHRQIIEEVVSGRMNMQAKLMTIMYNDWQEIKQQFIQEQKTNAHGEGNEQQEELQETEQEEDPFYAEAVKLVGKDLVELKED